MANKFKELKGIFKIRYPKIYSLIYDVPWYRIVTFFLIVQMHFMKMDVRDLSIENIELHKTTALFEKKVVELESVNKSLLDNMVMYNRSFEDFPWYVWNKVKRGYNFYSNYYNLVYEEDIFFPFGTNRYQNLGRTNFQNAPLFIASVWHKNDMYVAMNGGHNVFLEPQLDTNGKVIYQNNLKWRIKREKDTLIYGMQIPKIIQVDDKKR